MPSSINSTSSSPGGLISSGATDNELVIQTGGTTAISVDAAQNVTITEDLTVNGTFSGNIDVTTVTGTLPVANGGTGATTLTGVVKGSGTSAFTAGNVNLTSEVTGTLPVASGGTGATTLTANNVILGNGTSAVNFVAPGTNGNVLTSNGTTWTSATPAGGGVTSLNGETGAIVNTDFQDIGSYILAHRAITASTTANNLDAGNTIAGSSLRYNTNVGTRTQDGDSTLIFSSNTTWPGTGTAPSGTWRAMCRSRVTGVGGCSTTYFWLPALWVRIS
jgi:hypothetical protein